ncbi:hypothetical protein IF650_16265 [Cellulosimicrobium terreum]|nr:hypothetical protein [Cellulosimicrobium terreum]
MAEITPGAGEVSRAVVAGHDPAPGVEEALARLAGLEDAPTAEHVVVLESVHDALVAELARTED